MKKFFRRIFFADDDAAGAVFSLMLLIVSGFCIPNLASLHGRFIDILAAVNITVKSDWIIFISSILVLNCWVLLYCLFLSSAFFFNLDKSRYRWIFWTIFASHIAAFYICTVLDHSGVGLLFCGVLTYAGFNALCIRRHNYCWYIALLLCWFTSLPAMVVLADLSCWMEFDLEPTATQLIPVTWRVPIVYLSILTFAGFVFCNFKLWASAVNRRLRDVWGIGCNTLLVLLAVTYIITLCAALYQQKECAKAFTALEENFQRGISAEAVREIYYRNRKVDEKFHENLKKAWYELSTDDNIFNQIISEAGTLDKLPAAYCNKFFSPEVENVCRFFDAPLPAGKRNYRPGTLSSMLLADLNIMRQAARYFAWQIRIACEEKDYSKAMLAWNRSARITEYLAQETALISSLVLIAVEKIRLDGLAIMLSANILSNSDLSAIQQYLQKSAAKVAELNRNSLYFEAVLSADTLLGIAENGTLEDKPEYAGTGLKNYRFLAPGLWYLAGCNYCNLLKHYNVKNLCCANEKIEYSLENIFSAMLVPALNTAGKRMHELEMGYQTFAVLIEAEMIKRKTGRYPEKLPLDIVDYFSGKPLLYKVGNIEVRESYLKKEKHPDGAIESGEYYTLESRIKRVQGVAVWSVGKNKINENGLYGCVSNGKKRTDDHSAVIIGK